MSDFVTQSPRPRGDRLRHWVAIVGIGVLAASGISALQGAMPAPAEAAVTITTTPPTAQLAETGGYDDPAPDGAEDTLSADCIRYGANNGGTTGDASNTGGSNGSSTQNYIDGYSPTVSGGTSTAWSGHGSPGNICPGSGAVDLDVQSSLGFRPANVTSVLSGTVFNIGQMVHVNRVVSGGNNWFQGDLNLEFSGLDLTYRWQLNETSNECEGAGCANDHVSFLNQTGDAQFVIGGIRYNLVLIGFTAPTGAGNSCTSTTTNPSIINDFVTQEGVVTYGCLYGVIQQVRPITVIKQTVSPAGITEPSTAFGFTSTSSLASAPWGTDTPFTLTKGQSVTRDYTIGETITITENAQTAPWAFTSLTCVDGLGAPVGTINTGARQVTFTGDLTAQTASAVPITCTYTNTYSPRATLTLVKNVTTTGQQTPVALPADWNLSAVGSGGAVGWTIAGPSGAGAVTSQTVAAGTYTLSETALNADRTGGYVQNGAWTCTNGVGVTNGQITLSHGQSTTCTVSNRYVTGSLAITKTVTTAPAGGYAPSANLPFTATYSCQIGTRITSGSVTVRPSTVANGAAGSAVVIPNLPAGASCTVTETPAPTGSTGLADTSWLWGVPQVTTSPTVVPSGGTATVNITNSATQQVGSLALRKQVESRTGSNAAFTNTARTFTVGVECRIGTAVVFSQQVALAGTGAQTVLSGIPATAVCTVTETAPSGNDFVDASYSWDGNELPAPVTIVAGQAQSAVVTNFFTRTLVELTVTKVVSGGGYTAGDTFEIDWACGDLSGTVDLATGESETVDVPAGVACTVAESADRPALSGGYIWGTATYEGLTDGSVTVLIGESREVTVTNPTRIGFGQIEITKSIATFVAAVQPGTTFEITVACDAPERGRPRTSSRHSCSPRPWPPRS